MRKSQKQGGHTPHQETVKNGQKGAPKLPESPKTPKKVLGIDPGNSGALVITDGISLNFWEMPVIQIGRESYIEFEKLLQILKDLEKVHGIPHVFVEKAVPMAMGSKGAFTYGRGFEALLIAVRLTGFPMTLVEPARWVKEMHEGISQNLKPKVRSAIAVKRLFPKLVGSLPRGPKTKRLLDGPVDALLIAGYGLRRIGPVLPSREGAGHDGVVEGACTRDDGDFF